MNIGVIGLGSMGRRRLRILKKLYSKYNLIGIDTREDRLNQAKNEFGISTYSDISYLTNNNVDTVFVCTTPATHYTVFQHIDLEKMNTFSELDLVEKGYDRLLDAEAHGLKRHFLSSTPLYDENATFIASQAKCNGVVTYRFHVGQYLPDWHPWEDYRDFFAGKRETNGCREILGIEVPWLEQCFGKILKVSIVISRHLTKLQIDYPDMLSICVEHESGSIGQLLVNVVCPHPVHQIEIIGEKLYLLWDGKPNNVKIWREGCNELQQALPDIEFSIEKGYAEFISETPYEEEVKEFINGIHDPNVKFRYSYEESSRVLKMIDRIEGIA
jgi:predicted dehydrogenase